MGLRKSTILLFSLLLPVFGIDGPPKKPYHGQDGRGNTGILPVLLVESSLPPRYKSGLVDTATAAAQAYFTCLNDEYFKLKEAEPPKVYLSLTVAEARSLIESHGNLVEAGDGFYVPSINAAYAYLKENADDRISWDGLFLPIAEYYVHKRFDTAPLWFKYGLTTSMSKGAQINPDESGELILSDPCPEESLILLEEVEIKKRLNIVKLFVTTDIKFKADDKVNKAGDERSVESSWKSGKPFARLLFCWLYRTGNLKRYIVNVFKEGCELDVLEKSVEETRATISGELTDFIKNDCNALANLAKAEQTDDLGQKEALLAEAMNLIPDCWQARIELARLHYKSGRKTQCTQTLEPLLIREDELPYFTAAKLVAACLYDNGDYAGALEYYQKSEAKSGFYPYKYQIVYKIANCNHYLDKPKEAAKWYAEFLNLNWSLDDDTEPTRYAKKYVETFGECRHIDPNATRSAAASEESD